MQIQEIVDMVADDNDTISQAEARLGRKREGEDDSRYYEVLENVTKERLLDAAATIPSHPH